MAAKFKLLVINGPNLNMLGKREPEKYGSQSLDEIMDELSQVANAVNVELAHYQSNSESALIERIHQAWQVVDFIIINPAAYTHTSIALRDALLSVNIPFYEVHLTNVHAREPFRHHSYFSDVAEGALIGLGAMGYRMALEAAVNRLQNTH
ncbi:type II 3-dehydroquinate dehydratase [Pseudoalteromonas mariniglutinosa]|uniref:type II 3-dehydroquinate dehydratase n=1 Tax=Pseudoalteromonas mariniglutinosa TaxID=206042 RepID=UPI00384E326C